MGAWALGLFCCDYDFDLVRDFDEKCGLPALEITAGRQRRPDLSGSSCQETHSRITAMSTMSTDAREALPVNYSVFEKLCTDPLKIRSHLDNTGILARTFTQLRREALKVHPSFVRDPYGPGYRICLLGACAMTLGAKIRGNDRDAMSKYYRSCGLMRDAVIQIEHALDSATGYVDGCPWDFGIVGRDDPDFVFAPKEDQLFPGFDMLNVWSPDHGRGKPEMWALRGVVMHTIADKKPDVEDLAQALAALMFDPYATATTTISSTKADSKPEEWRAEAERLVGLYDFQDRSSTTQENRVQTCGSCGKETKLSKCGKCQEVYYCNRSCQKSDFPKHKAVCPLLARLKVKPGGLEECIEFMKQVNKIGG